MLENDIAKRFQAVQEKINKAKLEQSLCERQLSELRPKRDALEQKCAESYQCKISELPAKIQSMENEFTSLVEQLERHIEKAERS